MLLKGAEVIKLVYLFMVIKHITVMLAVSYSLGTHL